MERDMGYIREKLGDIANPRELELLRQSECSSCSHDKFCICQDLLESVTDYSVVLGKYIYTGRRGVLECGMWSYGLGDNDD